MNTESETVTAKEKALSLCQQFGLTGLKEQDTNFFTLDISHAKKCAVICVNNILFALKELEWDTDGDFDIDNHIKFWNEVGLEIEKISL